MSISVGVLLVLTDLGEYQCRGAPSTNKPGLVSEWGCS